MSVSMRVMIGFGPVHERLARDGQGGLVVPLPDAIAAPEVTRFLRCEPVEPFAQRALARRAGLKMVDGTIKAVTESQILFEDRPPLPYASLSVECAAAPLIAMLFGGTLSGPLRADSPRAATLLAPMLTGATTLVVGDGAGAGWLALNGPPGTRIIGCAADSPLLRPPWAGYLARAGVTVLPGVVVDLGHSGVTLADGTTALAQAIIVVDDHSLLPALADLPPSVRLYRPAPFADCSGRQLTALIKGRAVRGMVPLAGETAALPLPWLQQPSRLVRHIANNLWERHAPLPITITPPPMPSVPPQTGGEWAPGLTLQEGPGGTLALGLLRQFTSAGCEPFLFGQIAAEATLRTLMATGAEPRSATLSLGAADDDAFIAGVREQLSQRRVAMSVARHGGQGMALMLGGSAAPLRLVSQAGARPGDALVLLRLLGDGLLIAADHAGALAQDEWTEGVRAALAPLDSAIAALHAYGATAMSAVGESGLVGALAALSAASQVLISLDGDALKLPRPLARWLAGAPPPVTPELIGPTAPTDAEAWALAAPGFPGALVAAVAPDALGECLDALAAGGERAQIIGAVAAPPPGLSAGIVLRAR